RRWSRSMRTAIHCTRRCLPQARRSWRNYSKIGRTISRESQRAMKMGLAGARPSKRTPCTRQLLSVDQIDSMLVAAAFEGSVKPGANDFESGFNADHSLAK